MTAPDVCEEETGCVLPDGHRSPCRDVDGRRLD